MFRGQLENAKIHSRQLEQEREEDRWAEEGLKERLQFERLLFDISARFINIAPDQVDLEIESALRQILQFFQVDRCGLVQISPEKKSWRIIHVAYGSEVPPVPEKTNLPVTMFPWVYEKLTKRHEVVSFRTRDELPREAAIDKQTYEGLEIRSGLNIPILIDAEAVYTININSVRKERAWPEDYIPRLRLLGEILVNAWQLARTRQQLKDRLRFERLISDISAGFVSISSDEIENQINTCLQKITEFFAVDRCTLGLFSVDGKQLKRAFEYHVEGVEPGPIAISKDQSPWYISQLMQGKFVVINQLEDLPAKAEEERRLCLAKSMKSLVSIPMVIGQKTLGSCALVSERVERSWPEDLVQRMRLIAEVLGGALARKRSEESLRETEARLNLAATSAEAGLWSMDTVTGHIWATEKARELYGFVPNQELNFDGFIQVVDPDDRDRIRGSVERTMQTRSDFREEYRIVHPDGTIRWMDARGRPYFSPSGEPQRLMGVSIDI